VNRQFLRQSLVGCAALLGMVAAVELAAAVHRGLVCPGAPPTFAVPDRNFGWTHPASTTVRVFGCAGSRYEYSTVTTFNSKGLNSPEHSYDREPGTARVLVLGDSVAEAMQVERADNFSERLQVMLRQRKRQVEVINTGHSGYGTDNELLYFEHEGARYSPDVVLLAFNLQNDIAENSGTIAARMYTGGPQRPKADVRIGAGDNVVIDTSAFVRFEQQWNDRGWAVRPPMPWLRNNSFFVRRLFDLFLADRSKPAVAAGVPYPVHFDVYRTGNTPDWDEAWNVTSALLRELHRATEAAGAQLLVAVIPSHETVDPAQWSMFVQLFPALAGGSWDLELPRRRILDVLAAQHINFVDTTPLLRQHLSQGSGPDYFDFDPHPNAGGHLLIAQAVLPELERELDIHLPASHPAPR